MIIDTVEIKKLIESDMTGHKVAQLSPIRQTTFDRYKTKQYKLENMTLKTAGQLMEVVEHERKTAH